MVEFSAAVEYTGRGWLVGLWWSFGWRKSQDVVLVSRLSHETEASSLSSFTKHPGLPLYLLPVLVGKLLRTNGAMPAISNPPDKTLHV